MTEKFRWRCRGQSWHSSRPPQHADSDFRRRARLSPARRTASPPSLLPTPPRPGTRSPASAAPSRSRCSARSVCVCVYISFGCFTFHDHPPSPPPRFCVRNKFMSVFSCRLYISYFVCMYVYMYACVYVCVTCHVVN